MTQFERLQARIQEPVDSAILEEMLESAKNIILSVRFPYAEWPETIEARYLDLQVRMAEDLFNRLGAAGNLSYSDNTGSRRWGAEWVSNQLLAEITPMAGVV